MVVVGAISAPAFRSWREENGLSACLKPMSADALPQAALVSVTRTGGDAPGGTEHHLCRVVPVGPGVIRACLYQSARTPAESDAIARLDLANGVTSFHVALRDTGMHLRVRTRPVRAHMKPGVAVWCTWPLSSLKRKRRKDADKDLDDEDPTATPSCRFWQSPSYVDVAAFAKHLCVVVGGEEARLVRYECDTAHLHCGASWCRGVVAWRTGDADDEERGFEFYRIV